MQRPHGQPHRPLPDRRKAARPFAAAADLGRAAPRPRLHLIPPALTARRCDRPLARRGQICFDRVGQYRICREGTTTTADRDNAAVCRPGSVTTASLPTTGPLRLLQTSGNSAGIPPCRQRRKSGAIGELSWRREMDSNHRYPGRGEVVLSNEGDDFVALITPSECCV
jgi:hypothetical protein